MCTMAHVVWHTHTVIILKTFWLHLLAVTWGPAVALEESAREILRDDKTMLISTSFITEMETTGTPRNTEAAMTYAKYQMGVKSD